MSWTVLHAAADAGRVSAAQVLLAGRAHAEAKEMLEAKWWDDATVSQRCALSLFLFSVLASAFVSCVYVVRACAS